MNIIIFTKPVQTGKTTELMQWCQLQKNIAGIVMPDRNGIRKMKDIRTGREWSAECINAASTNEELINVGRFCFYQSAFDRANKTLLDNQHSSWLVIDEIGKLELERKGFYPALVELLNHEKPQNLLLVIRESLVEEAAGFFNLQNFKLVNCLPSIL